MSQAPACKTEGCRQARYRGSSYCGQCRTRREKERNPEGVAYYKLKHRAKKRGVVFLLTLAQFKEFCTQHVYLAGRGRTSTGYHIDRIDESKGYYLGNLQVLTNAENIAKSNNYRAYRRRLIQWLELGGTGPVPGFVPTKRVPSFEYYRGKLLSVTYHEPTTDTTPPPF